MCAAEPDLEFDFDVLAFDSDFIASDVSRCRCAQYDSARDVKDGPVPRAGHFCAHKHSFGEWSAPMGTGVVNRIERSVDDKNRYSLPAGFHYLTLTRGDLTGSGTPDELCHCIPPGGYHI